MKRPKIPASLRRRILVEAGHRCAIPTCKYPLTENAHIIPFSKAKEHKYENLIPLCPNCHARHHKGDISKKALKMYKRKLAFLSGRYLPYELRVLEELRKKGYANIDSGHLIVQMLLDDGFVKIHSVGLSRTMTDREGVNFQEPVHFTVILTEKGERFIESWVDPDEELVF